MMVLSWMLHLVLHNSGSALCSCTRRMYDYRIPPSFFTRLLSVSYFFCPFQFDSPALPFSFHGNNILLSPQITVTMDPISLSIVSLFFLLINLALLGPCTYSNKKTFVCCQWKLLLCFLLFLLENIHTDRCLRWRSSHPQSVWRIKQRSGSLIPNQITTLLWFS